jgi:poly(beta-D-mannuronate) lyase
MALTGSPALSACPTPPAAVRDIALPRFYADAEGSEIDPKLAAAHKKAVEPLTAWLRHVVSDADKAWTRAKLKARDESARCALAWLAAWAKAGALLGRMETRQAEYQRKWDACGAALAWIKVKRYATPEQRAVVEPWLVRLADASRAFFDDTGRKRNNHWYWMGLLAGATAIATGSERHWKMAREIMADAARDIGPDGSLAHELDRKGRALHYHAFAAMPLVTLAELAHAVGDDFYAGGDGALHRLAGLTILGLGDPTVFDRRVGEALERPVRPFAGWMQLYAARFPARMQGALPGDPAKGHRWLGGDVAVLKEALGVRW